MSREDLNHPYMISRGQEDGGPVRGLGKGIRPRSRKRTSFKDFAGPADSQLQLSSLKVCTPLPQGSCLQCPCCCWHTSMHHRILFLDCVDLVMLLHQCAVVMLLPPQAGLAMSTTSTSSLDRMLWTITSSVAAGFAKQSSCTVWI